MRAANRSWYIYTTPMYTTHSKSIPLLFAPGCQSVALLFSFRNIVVIKIITYLRS